MTEDDVADGISSGRLKKFYFESKSHNGGYLIFAEDMMDAFVKMSDVADAWPVDAETAAAHLDMVRHGIPVAL